MSILWDQLGGCMSKICQYCHKEYTGSTAKNTCYACYGMIKKYGTSTPPHFNKKCATCGKEYLSKKSRQKYCTNDCYKEARRNFTYLAYRKKYNIDLSLPKKFKKPNGSGHKDPHGYIYINKMRHPNAQKQGRIYQHTYVMSEHLGRPLRKGENVHHKNGIRNDNRIENLELWSTSQPAGQRVEDKVKWCREFLRNYDKEFPETPLT